MEKARAQLGVKQLNGRISVRSYDGVINSGSDAGAGRDRMVLVSKRNEHRKYPAKMSDGATWNSNLIRMEFLWLIWNALELKFIA